MNQAIIGFTLVNRKTRAQVPGWIATVSFADGPGMPVKRITTTTNRAKAARFAIDNAYAIAVQFSQSPATLQTPDGAILAEQTERLQADQRTRLAAHQAAQRDVAEVFAQALASIRR